MTSRFVRDARVWRCSALPRWRRLRSRCSPCCARERPDRRPVSVPGGPAAALPAAAVSEQQQQQQPQWSPFGFEQPRQQPVDASRAPAPRRADVTPATKVVVFGDSLADWLAFGLEEAFSDTPEIGVLRKHRTNAGLIRVDVRGESYDWPSAARDMLNADKPDYVVMMIGLSDRRGIREAIRQQPARPPAGQKQQPQQPPRPRRLRPAPAQQQAAAPASACSGKTGRRRSGRAGARARCGAGQRSIERHRTRNGDRRNGGARIPLREVGRALLGASTK